MSWDRVRAWRDRLAAIAPPQSGLSAPGAKEAWGASLGALDDDSLDAVAEMGLKPWKSAAVVCASTVFTAPIEWCAVLLGRGSEVILKVPSADPHFGRLLVEAAAATGLPLTATTDRERIQHAEYVVAMGSDEAVREIGTAVANAAHYEPHGHRFSAAWIGGDPLPYDPLVPEGFRDPHGSVAADAALYDGRGCLSPVVLLTSQDGTTDLLAEALARAEERWPRGQISDLEAASIRTRAALARVSGRVVEGASWSVHQLPADHWRPLALPRSIAVVRTADRAEAARILDRHRSSLSTIGSDQPWEVAPRVCRLGRMQRPALDRLHDGVDWLRTTARP